MAKALREIIPLTDLITVDEMTLSRIAMALDAKDPVGTVSPEKSGMTSAQKHTASMNMRAALDRESKKGMISYTGTHAGRYKYDAAKSPSKEGAFVLRPGDHPKAKENFHRIISHLAKHFGQESFLKIQKHGDGPATGALYYPAGGKRYGSKNVKPLGQIHYNEPLDQEDSGDTKLKHRSSSFTVRK